jgi:hypothetical protein
MTRGQAAYRRAMEVSDDLISQMRNASSLRDPGRSVVADIWKRRHNVPFMTTVYEAVAEMKSATDQVPE